MGVAGTCLDAREIRKGEVYYRSVPFSLTTKNVLVLFFAPFQDPQIAADESSADT